MGLPHYDFLRLPSRCCSKQMEPDKSLSYRAIMPH